MSDAIPVLTDRKSLLSEDSLLERVGKTGSSRRNLNALSFHSLRRTATTLLHEAGIAGAVAQALIGHDSEAIHEHYVNVGRDALQKAVAEFPSILVLPAKEAATPRKLPAASAQPGQDLASPAPPVA